MHIINHRHGPLEKWIVHIFNQSNHWFLYESIDESPEPSPSLKAFYVSDNMDWAEVFNDKKKATEFVMEFRKEVEADESLLGLWEEREKAIGSIEGCHKVYGAWIQKVKAVPSDEYFSGYEIVETCL